MQRVKVSQVRRHRTSCAKVPRAGSGRVGTFAQVPHLTQAPSGIHSQRAWAIYKALKRVYAVVVQYHQPHSHVTYHRGGQMGTCGGKGHTITGP
jgi:hypothetical protein